MMIVGGGGADVVPRGADVMGPKAPGADIRGLTGISIVRSGVEGRDARCGRVGGVLDTGGW